MVTDWPRVDQFIDAYQAAFAPLGIFAGLISLGVKILFLFLASFGFEVVFLVMLVCLLELLLNCGRSPARTAPYTER